MIVTQDRDRYYNMKGDLRYIILHLLISQLPLITIINYSGNWLQLYHKMANGGHNTVFYTC